MIGATDTMTGGPASDGGAVPAWAPLSGRVIEALNILGVVFEEILLLNGHEPMDGSDFTSFKAATLRSMGETLHYLRNDASLARLLDATPYYSDALDSLDALLCMSDPIAAPLSGRAAGVPSEAAGTGGSLPPPSNRG